MKKLKISEKLKIIFLLKMIIGSITTIFLSKIIGIILLIAGIITLIYIIKTKNKSDYEKQKSIAHLHIIIGVLMLFGAIIILLSSSPHTNMKVIIKTTIGIILILKGIYEIYKIKK
jgi:uncharacterized membrane protein HdeD (DUF308 family)